MHEKEPQKPLEHTSEHVKSQNFLGACPQTPLILWPPFLYLPWAPPILSAALQSRAEKKVVFSSSTFVYIMFESTEPLWFICVHSAQEISTTNVMVYHHGVSLSEQHTIY